MTPNPATALLLFIPAELDWFSISLWLCLRLALLETFCLVATDQRVPGFSIKRDVAFLTLLHLLFLSSISRGDSRRTLSVRVVESLRFQKKTSRRCLNLHLLPHAWTRSSYRVCVGSPASAVARLTILIFLWHSARYQTFTAELINSAMNGAVEMGMSPKRGP